MFQSAWWMRLYQSTSPKRHICYASSPWVARFNLGRLTGWQPSQNPKKNTVVYVDKATGKRKWHGSKHLKETEPFPQFSDGLWFQHISTYNLWIQYFISRNTPSAVNQVLSPTFWDEDCADHASPDRRLPGTRVPTWGRCKGHIPLYGIWWHVGWCWPKVMYPLPKRFH